jgi:sulfate permease, SulP family
MGAALVGGLPGAGASIRTIVNIEAGGKTRLSGVIHGLFLLVVLLGLSNLVQYIPNAVLAGILVGAGLGCIDFRGLSHLRKVSRSDAVVLLIVLGLTVFSGLIVAVAVGLIIASFVFMKKVADISERQTAISPLADEPWADEIDIPTPYRDRLFVKHVEGPLFFGFARGFLNIAASAAAGRLLVIRMDRVTLIDQSGAYALHDAIVDLKSSGMRVVLVGLPVAQRDILEAIHVIPDLVATEDLFTDFAGLKAALPTMLAEIGPPEERIVSHSSPMA